MKDIVEKIRKLNGGSGLVEAPFRKGVEDEIGSENLESVEIAIFEMIKDCPNLDSTRFPPLEIARPTVHETKTDFLKYISDLEKALKASEDLNRALAGLKGDNGEDRLDWMGGWGSPNETDELEDDDAYYDSQEYLVTRMVSVFGFSRFLILATERIRGELQRQKNEIEHSQNQYWDIAHRPPDYYARAIAQRLAEIFVHAYKKRPTFGTNGGVPSTSYSLALERVFLALGITTGVRGPAEYVISNITDEDIQKANKLGGLIRPISSTGYIRKRLPEELKDKPGQMPED